MRLDTVGDIEMLCANSVEESIDLEFKNGYELRELNNETRSAIVKDVTAFANAGGGSLVYGVDEQKAGAVSVASKIAAVTNPQVTQDTLTRIIHDNTAPPLHDFRVRPIRVSNDGFVFVVEVAQGRTAHQNRKDHKYYKRTGAVNNPMEDHEIRDVMNRRSAPVLELEPVIRSARNSGREHYYNVSAILRNVGARTANLWALNIIVPILAATEDGPNLNRIMHVADDPEYPRHARYEIASNALNHPHNPIVLPGQCLELSHRTGIGEVRLRVDDHRYEKLVEQAPPIVFLLFVDDAIPRRCEIPFGNWCGY